MIKNKKLTCFLVLMIFLCSFISYKAGKNSTAVTGQNTNSGATADYGSCGCYKGKILF